MQKKVNDKYYLYVQYLKGQGVSIIDISQPAQPKAIGVIPRPDPAVSSKMNITGDLAIIAETEVLPTRSNTPGMTLCFGICRIRRLLGWCKNSREWSSGFKTSEISFMS
jgi:hypothetical protein